MFYWLLKRVILGPLLHAFFRPWVKGLENIPETGAAILASNHLSFSDSFFLPLMVDRRITFLAKDDYFNGRGLKGMLTASFFRSAGQVPIDRTGGAASDAALNTGLRILGGGNLLGIYPEGTRSPDARLYRGKTGVARMALEAGVPVIPVVMIDTEKVQPIGKKIPHITQVGVIIGKPLDFSRYEGMAGDRFVLRSITDEIMYELMRLSGQEYADLYAATMKERLKAADRTPALVGAGSGSEPDGPVHTATTPGRRVVATLDNGSAEGLRADRPDTGGADADGLVDDLTRDTTEDRSPGQAAG